MNDTIADEVIVFNKDPQEILLEYVGKEEWKEALKSVEDTQKAGFLFGISISGAILSMQGHRAKIAKSGLDYESDILKLHSENESLKAELTAAQQAINAAKAKLRAAGLLL